MANQAYKSLEQIFTNQISVLNIAVPVDAVSLEKAKIQCSQNNFDYHLVKEYEHYGLKVFEKKLNIVREIADSEIIADSTPIIEVMEALCTQDHLFVKVKRNITHLVARSDLDSIPVRIWLFGMVNLFEIDIRNKIEASGMNWEAFLSVGRLEKARELYREKEKNNEEINLLGCLQLVDLGSILKKNREFLNDTLGGLNAKENFNSAFKKINLLRDSLAHGQKINMEWHEIFQLMQFISNALTQ